jgi:hypothetical protein
MDDYPDVVEPVPEIVQYGELVRFLTESHEMRVTARNALKQSLYAAGGAFTGAFLMGPIGGLVGGIFGSIVGFFKSDEYDGAVLAISKLEGERRTQLMSEVMTVLTTAGATTQQMANAEVFHDTLYRLAEQDSVRNGIWSACVHAIQS